MAPADRDADRQRLRRVRDAGPRTREPWRRRVLAVAGVDIEAVNDRRRGVADAAVHSHVDGRDSATGSARRASRELSATARSVRPICSSARPRRVAIRRPRRFAGEDPWPLGQPGRPRRASRLRPRASPKRRRCRCGQRRRRRRRLLLRGECRGAARRRAAAAAFAETLHPYQRPRWLHQVPRCPDGDRQADAPEAPGPAPHAGLTPATGTTQMATTATLDARTATMLTVERAGRVVVATLSRPPVNALDDALIGDSRRWSATCAPIRTSRSCTCAAARACSAPARTWR